MGEVMATLAEKVYSAMDERGPIEYADYPTPEENRKAVTLDDCRDLTEYEVSLRDWGLYYGIAWAIARAEDPFEAPEEVGVRAREAAEEAWHRSNLLSEVRPIGQPPQRFRQKSGAG